MENKKYELVKDQPNRVGFRTLYRIKALKDFGDVKVGDIGGWVESEKNLSQEGNCWIYPEVFLYDNSRVENDAVVCGESIIKGCGKVSGKAYLENCSVEDGAVVEGTARVIGSTRSPYAIVIKDSAVVRSNVYGKFIICGSAIIDGDYHPQEYKQWISGIIRDGNDPVTYPAPSGTEYKNYTDGITTYTKEDLWSFRDDENGVIEVTSREIDSLLPELIGPKFAQYMRHIRDAHHSIYDIELFEDDFE